jgi:hypothetical protein
MELLFGRCFISKSIFCFLSSFQCLPETHCHWQRKLVLLIKHILWQLCLKFVYLFTAGQFIFLQVKSHILFLPNNLVTLSGSSADLFHWNSIPSWSSSDENRKSNNLIAHFDGRLCHYIKMN